MVYHFSLLQHSLFAILTFYHVCRKTVSWGQSYMPPTRYAISLFSKILCPSYFRFPICAEGRSAEHSAKCLDKVCHIRIPPTWSVCHLYISPSVQRDGQLMTVLKALTKSPIAKEVKDVLTLLEQHDAQSTCYVSGSNKIKGRRRAVPSSLWDVCLGSGFDFR